MSSAILSSMGCEHNILHLKVNIQQRVIFSSFITPHSHENSSGPVIWMSGWKAS